MAVIYYQWSPKCSVSFNIQWQEWAEEYVVISLSSRKFASKPLYVNNIIKVYGCKCSLEDKTNKISVINYLSMIQNEHISKHVGTDFHVS